MDNLAITISYCSVLNAMYGSLCINLYQENIDGRLHMEQAKS
jgi:hypothetical protein